MFGAGEIKNFGSGAQAGFDNFRFIGFCRDGNRIRSELLNNGYELGDLVWRCYP
jgi:hypothetical protein